MTTHTVTPTDSTDTTDSGGEIRGGIFKYTLPDHIHPRDVPELARKYNDEVEKDPTEGVICLCESWWEQDCGGKMVEVKFTNRVGLDPDPAEFAESKAWVDGVLEWINETEPEVEGAQRW